MSSNQSTKPVFGPLVSPDLFNTRWQERIRSTIHQYVSLAQPRIRTFSRAEVHDFETETNNMTSHFFWTALYCNREANALGLTRDTGAALEDLPHVQSTVTNVVVQWRWTKAGRAHFQGGLFWRDLPLVLRRKINDLIAEVRKARGAGEWSVDITDEAFVEARQAEGVAIG